MEKEIEKWIGENNPYCKTHPCNECIKNIFHNQCQISPSECEKYKALINVKYGWQEGAKAMADHLEEQPTFSFAEIVDIMCPAKHDGTNYGLLAEMLVAKVKYINNHKFASLEEERQWMVDYLKENYKKHIER